MQRYFRANDASLYESVRLQLDAAWGHVAPVTCMDPAAIAPADAAGRVVVAVHDEWCQYAAVEAVLPGLLASGDVVEISESEYRAAVDRPYWAIVSR